MSATAHTAPLAHSLAELDRILGLRRGQAAYLASKGVFAAHEGPGRMSVVYDHELADVANLIRAYVVPPEGLSAEAASLRLGITLSTVYTLVTKGRLARVAGSRSRRGQLRISVASINQYDVERQLRRRKGDSHVPSPPPPPVTAPPTLAD